MSGPVCVRVPRVLLPRPGIDLTRWAVIACDQFTSQPEYWREVEHLVGNAPSTLRMVLPELHLHDHDVAQRISRAQASMTEYLASGVLEPHEAMVYVERGVSGGVQRGLVVELDLEAYDFTGDSRALVRSTEGTVLDRLPPRMTVRRDAALELPHILVLYDDPSGAVLAPVLAARDELGVAYDVELMLGSGHLTGRFLPPAIADAVLDAVGALLDPAAYTARYGLPFTDPLLFAMGDGNHSLAAAKSIWEELKSSGAGPDHPARFALVELVNLHDASLSFEPIHRVVFDAPSLAGDVVDLLGATLTPTSTLQEVLDAVGAGGAGVAGGASGAGAAPAASQVFGVVSEAGHGLLEVASPTHQLPVGTLQEFLDRWLAAHPEASIDYVHGEDIADELGRRPGNVAFILPGIGKDAFFRSIAVDGTLPRKTFSLGHAHDKRFYMECRAIR